MTDPTKVPSKDKRPTLPVALFASAVFVGVSINLLWLSARGDPGVHAPLGAIIGIAMVFIGGSAMMVLSALRKDRFQEYLVVVVLVGFTIASGGISLFGDPRYCSSSGTFLLPLPGCRIAFGASAVFFGFVTMLQVQRVWSRRRRSHY